MVSHFHIIMANSLPKLWYIKLFLRIIKPGFPQIFRTFVQTFALETDFFYSFVLVWFFKTKV